uniref:Uncharacterized protein n=1 Tax=Magallana gigas TaxID=29159 RepID=A0A8W8MN55_MAGGI
MYKLSLKKYMFGKMESQDDDHDIPCNQEQRGPFLCDHVWQTTTVMRWQLECCPNLGHESINKEFQEIRKTKTNTIKDKILKSAVEFMDDKIGLAINKLREIRGKILNTIGKSTQRLEQLNLNSKKKPDS